MPLGTTGIEVFRQRHPTFDGRGVLIAVLDGGIDPSVPGLETTTGGERKLLDLRDLSNEGRISLRHVAPVGDTVRVDGQALLGFGRIGRLSSGPFYGGVLHEERLGSGRAADVNGNGSTTDQVPIVVAHASDGWFMITDTDGDGSLANERPVHDYAEGGETFAYGPGTLGLAANLADSAGYPVLDLFFDNSGHGTHVAGIVAGHNLFGIPGFDGVAPGARVLGIKIADNAWGKISVTGSMAAALDYAADYAARHGLPLVINLSYVVGNEREGSAVIDSLVDAFAMRHPDVLVVLAAGNDGPGISTVGSPASADLGLTACALVPGVFARAPQAGVAPAPDVLGWWSARGGEVAKPDVCAPGIAFSNVPPWQTGAEIAGGTSQAAPQVTGAVAVLQSAMLQEGRRVRAIDLKRALMATAQRVPGATALDEGSGVPNVPAAFDWLRAAHQAGVYLVHPLADGGNTSNASAAYRRDGLASPADTVQQFVVSTVGGQSAARLLLSSDADWLHAPREIALSGQPETVTLTYDAAKLRAPGLYVGTVWARAASDTLAGTVFRLTNTVVVPYSLSRPFSTRHSLSPGQIERYFFAVPPRAGGLNVRVSAATGRGATLYLFEPSGQPYRGENNVEVAPGDSGNAIVVSGEDVQAGVYEAVVVAPAGEGVTYGLDAALPVLAVRAIGTGPSAVFENQGGDSCVASVSARLVGASRNFDLRGDGGVASVDVQVPDWATRAVLDVMVPDSLWERITDFGLGVRDASRRVLSDRPLNAARGRRTVALDSVARGRPLTISALPAFARSGDQAPWHASVRVAFFRADPVPLPVLGGGFTTRLTLRAGETIGLEFAAVPEGADVPALYAPLLDVMAEPGAGPTATRQAAVLGGAHAP
jgi:tripeptidyl-peptidase-2